MKLLLCILMSLIIKNQDKKRKIQYINGLKKLFEYDFKNIEVMLIDNTTESLDKEILKYIPKNVKVICSINNNYGSRNKGAGLIETWLKYKNILNKYDFIIHFEPRQLLTSHSFFDNIINTPRNLFKVTLSTKYHFYTGLFCIKKDILLKFIEKYSPKYLTDNYI